MALPTRLPLPFRSHKLSASGWSYRRVPRWELALHPAVLLPAMLALSVTLTMTEVWRPAFYLAPVAFMVTMFAALALRGPAGFTLRVRDGEKARAFTLSASGTSARYYYHVRQGGRVVSSGDFPRVSLERLLEDGGANPLETSTITEALWEASSRRRSNVLPRPFISFSEMGQLGGIGTNVTIALSRPYRRAAMSFMVGLSGLYSLIYIGTISAWFWWAAPVAIMIGLFSHVAWHWAIGFNAYSYVRPYRGRPDADGVKDCLVAQKSARAMVVGSPVEASVKDRYLALAASAELSYTAFLAQAPELEHKSLMATHLRNMGELTRRFEKLGQDIIEAQARDPQGTLIGAFLRAKIDLAKEPDSSRYSGMMTKEEARKAMGF